jgi:hypothetical protein
MMLMYVQFTDATETVIASVFSALQSTACPNQGTVTANDARWAAYYATLPGSMQGALMLPTTTDTPALSA